jgi:hypothetical protein
LHRGRKLRKLEENVIFQGEKTLHKNIVLIHLHKCKLGPPPCVGREIEIKLALNIERLQTTGFF